MSNTNGRNIEQLLSVLVTDNRDRPQLAELRVWLCPDGSISMDRFAALMIFATRLVAFIPGAEEIFNTQVEGVRP